MKRSKWALLMALAAVNVVPALAHAEETVVTSAEQVTQAAEAAYKLRPRVTPEGALVGDIGYLVGDQTVRTVPNLPITLVKNGAVVARVASNADGEFAFPQVAPGVYTIVASNSSLLHVASMVVGPNDGGPGEPAHLIAASPVSVERRRAMMTGINGAVSAAPAQNVAFNSVASTYRAIVSAEGVVTGSVSAIGMPAGSVDMTGMVVRVFRAGAVVGEAAVGADGNYAISGMSPGPISVVAFGPQGFAAVAIELVSGQPVAAVAGASSESLVSTIQEGGGGLDIEIAPVADVQAGASVSGDSFTSPFAPIGPEGALAGAAGAGQGSTGSFGGGGGGSGGGMDGIGALGALGIAAAAIAAGDDDGGFVPTTSTPGGGT